MQKLMVIAACIFTMINAVAQEKMTLSLSEAVDLGLSQNFDQQIIEVSRLSSEESLAQSKRDLLPDLNAQLSQGVSNLNSNGSYSLNASATLWNGGIKMNTIRLSKLELEQMDEQIIAAQNSLAISIINIYLQAVMNQDLYKYQEEVYNISVEQAALGESRYKAGDILESDYLLLKAQAASDANSLTNSRIERDNAIIKLKNLLAIEHSTELALSIPEDELNIDEIPLPTLGDLIDISMEWLPEIKLAQSSISIAEKNVDIVKGSLMPTLRLNGSVGTSYNSSLNSSWGSQFGDNNINSVSLSLSIPIFNKGKSRSNIKQADYMAEQAEIEAEKTEFEVRNQLEQEYNNALAHEQRTKSAEESWNAYEETFRVFSTQFEEGAVSTTELLQQQNNYLTSLNSFIQSKYNYILARKVLDVYMGVEIKL